MSIRRMRSIALLCLLFINSVCLANRVCAFPDVKHNGDVQISTANAHANYVAEEAAIVDERYILPRPVDVRKMVSDLPLPQHEESSTLTRFQRTLRHYGSPVICDMIFCHTSCADYDDSCPSFNHHLLSALDEFGSCTRMNESKLQNINPAADCCVESLHSLETFSSSRSQFK